MSEIAFPTTKILSQFAPEKTKRSVRISRNLRASEEEPSIGRTPKPVAIATQKFGGESGINLTGHNRT
jgi:hypothetical protein